MADRRSKSTLWGDRMSARTNSDQFGLCPVCSDDPEILNVGREHFAICRKHQVYWPVGSNLFSGWRNDEPATWDANKQLLATFTSADEMQTDASQVFKAMSRYNIFTDSGPRPKLGTLGDCLQEVAYNRPEGYTRITGGSNSNSCRWPCDETPTLPWLSIEPVTASIEPAPVTILIDDRVGPDEARRILKLACKWLKLHDSLEKFTPVSRFAPDGDETFPF